LRVLQRQENGSWLIVAEMCNANQEVTYQVNSKPLEG
jgi:hypothetical protein